LEGGLHPGEKKLSILESKHGWTAGLASNDSYRSVRAIKVFKNWPASTLLMHLSKQSLFFLDFAEIGELIGLGLVSIQLPPSGEKAQ
jgi:hypothetical protein